MFCLYRKLNNAESIQESSQRNPTPENALDLDYREENILYPSKIFFLWFCCTLLKMIQTFEFEQVTYSVTLKK